jgi:hypothetical protein
VIACGKQLALQLHSRLSHLGVDLGELAAEPFNAVLHIFDVPAEIVRGHTIVSEHALCQ